MKSSDLNPENYNEYYQTYIDKVGDAELLTMLEKQLGNFPNFISSLPENKMNYAYAEGKWTIAMVLQHIIDTERVFQYRAMRIARNDKTPLPGFDQDNFVQEVNVSNKSKETFIDEYRATRASTVTLYQSFDEESLKRVGVASGAPSSVASLGFIICGHQRHHRDIIRERYL
jgi:uncharacterized damage-inducible protein DinB